MTNWDACAAGALMGYSVPSQRILPHTQSTARAIMVDGHVVMLTTSMHESMTETASILGDDDAMAAIRESENQLATGNVVAWDDLKRELGL
jgi:hypothetical protein